MLRAAERSRKPRPGDSSITPSANWETPGSGEGAVGERIDAEKISVKVCCQVGFLGEKCWNQFVVESPPPPSKKTKQNKKQGTAGMKSLVFESS